MVYFQPWCETLVLFLLHRLPPPLWTSPTKSEFIRAKYQMLAFVHKLPCRDDDGVTTKDLSKVRAQDSHALGRIAVLRG